MMRLAVLFVLCAGLAPAATADSKAIVDSYEIVWTTLRDHYWDATMAGLDWQKLHDQYLVKVKAAATISDARKPINELIHKLPSSHLALIPAEGITTDTPQEPPTGKLVQFGNLPPMRVIAEHRKLPGGAGYIRLNVFLDPVSVMPEFEQAITDFRSAPGIILDLRGNPGGLSIMAMGLAGWFVSDEGLVLGTMQGRKSTIKFEINPRLEAYTGKLAVLVDGSSASTSEFLAQGLKDLGRARIFGTRTAGEALPSQVIELPDGDRFQYPEANYTSFKGRVLEGNGVEPDVVVAQLPGHDLALESATNWITPK